MKTVCPYCKYKATNHETLDDQKDFKDGDISFCIHCGEISAFKSDTRKGLIRIDINSLDRETRKEVNDMEYAWLKTRGKYTKLPTTNKNSECRTHRLDTSGLRCVDCGKILEEIK